MKKQYFKILLIIFILILNCGCILSKKIVLYPIAKTDIFRIEENEKIERSKNEIIYVKKSGWFISDFYLNEIVKAKVK